MLIAELDQSQHLPVAFRIRPPTGEVIERDLGGLDNMFSHERRAFRRPLLWALHTAFPLDHRPSIEAGFGQQREHAGEINLSVAQRTEAPGPLCPRLISAID